MNSPVIPDDQPFHPAPAASASYRAGFALGASGRTIVVELWSDGESLNRCAISLPQAPPPPAPVDLPTELCPVLTAAIAQLAEYFRGERRTFDLPLSPSSGTPFQRDVWRACSAIPYGQTRSYWWTAVRAGNPYATRAVGSALGANPLPLFIPCHRVIRSDGALGGFSADPGLKELLLALEGGEAAADFLPDLSS